jgi:uncharacterized membrane protein HdeD (DUF308 family)
MEVIVNSPAPILGSLRLEMARHWWILLVRGLVSILFGVMAFVWPGITLASLVLLYAAYCFADGIVALLGGSGGRLWQSLLIGIISVAAGVAALFYPGLTALVLLYLIGAWAIVRGVFEIAAAFALRKVIEGELMLILAGLFSIAFGVFILLFPGAGALSVIWILGTYSLIFGVLLVALSFRVKALAHA